MVCFLNYQVNYDVKFRLVPLPWLCYESASFGFFIASLDDDKTADIK